MTLKIHLEMYYKPSRPKTISVPKSVSTSIPTPMLQLCRPQYMSKAVIASLHPVISPSHRKGTSLGRGWEKSTNKMTFLPGHFGTGKANLNLGKPKLI
ncbi:hypothetical protein BDW62DRAFT_101835 [Aspergillus aurantiobrunneus]